MEASATAWRPRYPPIVIALTVTLATFMEILDTSIANVALPHIAGSLSASIDESTWVLTSYLVSNAVILPLSGWFSNLLGRKRFYMICVVLFTVSSLLCGLAPNLGMLVFFRILQGIGGGGLQPSEQAILVDTFEPAKRGMGMAIYGMAVVTAPIIGPTLGGWITDNFSWRWIFFINIPVGLISLFLTAKFVEDPPYITAKAKQKIRIDYPGLILLCLGLGLLQFVLDKGERADWFGSTYIWVSAWISATCLISAAIWEWRTRNPIVDLHLLKERNFLISNMLMFVLGFVLYGSTVLLPLFLQTLLGYSSTWSGLALSPGGLITLFLMPFVGLFMGRFDGRILVVLGVCLVSTGLFIMSHFNLSVDFEHAMLSRIVQSAGLAFLFVPINAMAFSFVPKDKSNNATGIINLARNIGGSVGISFAATLIARRTQFHQARLADHLTPTNPTLIEHFKGLAEHIHHSGHTMYEGLLGAKAAVYHQLIRHTSMLAYVDTFWFFAIAFLTLIPLVLLMKRSIPGKDLILH